MVNRKKHIAAGVLVIFSGIFLTVGCEKTTESGHNPPSDHTISKDGFKHKSGLTQPLVNCVVCHGSDLNGGTAGVSCYECHGRKW